MSDVTIAELVRNGTLNADMAAVLWCAVDAEVSFLTAAVPRLAGKSTTSNAVLALRRPTTPLTPVYGERAEMAALQQQQRGGYLVVAEFSQAPMPGYIWGEPVRRVFETASAGYALQACLHAPGVEAAIRDVTQGNSVNDRQASLIKLVLYIERFGTSSANFWRRLSEVYEVHAVENGRPVGHPLFRWQRETDSFEQLSPPHQFGRDDADRQHRAAIIDELARSGRTTAAAVAAAVAGYRASTSL